MRCGCRRSAGRSRLRGRSAGRSFGQQCLDSFGGARQCRRMDKLLTIWPAYARAVALVGFGLAMRSLWGIGWTIVVVWVARVVFVVTGIAWEVSADNPFGIR